MATDKSISKELIITVLAKLKEVSKERKFNQTWDMSVSLKELDMKKPESKFTEEFLLPHGPGKELKITAIVDTLAPKVKDLANVVISKDQVPVIGQDKKGLKKLAGNTDFFLSEISLMPLVGKNMGSILAPRGKMPKPLPPNADVENVITRVRKSIKIKLKDSPVINMMVGNEKMKDDEVAENIMAIIEYLERKLPKGKNNMKTISIKLTMGKPEKIKV